MSTSPFDGVTMARSQTSVSVPDTTESPLVSGASSSMVMCHLGAWLPAGLPEELLMRIRGQL
jgi:hypothetical protein